MPRSPRKSCVLVFVLVLAALTGCLQDAERGNPLDPRSGDFENAGRVAGQVTRRSSILALEGVEVRLIPLAPEGQPFLGITTGQGAFTFNSVPAGDYRVEVVKEGYAPATDTLTVLPGQTLRPAYELNGLPSLSNVLVLSKHLSRWVPEPREKYRLEVVATVGDLDGLTDVVEVWAELPDQPPLSPYRVELRPVPDPDQEPRCVGRAGGCYQGSVAADSLSLPSPFLLLGQRVPVRARDALGTTTTVDDPVLARIIEQTPVATDPINGRLIPSSTTIMLHWTAPPLPYPVTYRVELVDLSTNSTIPLARNLPPEQTAALVSLSLSPGPYQWFVWIVDQYGNESRSREAGFVVQ